MPEPTSLEQRLSRALALAPEAVGWDADEEASGRLLSALARRRARRHRAAGGLAAVAAVVAIVTPLALTGASAPSGIRSAAPAAPTGPVPSGCGAVAVGAGTFECAGTLSTFTAKSPASGLALPSPGSTAGPSAFGPAAGASHAPMAQTPTAQISVPVGSRLTVVLPPLHGLTWGTPPSTAVVRVVRARVDRATGEVRVDLVAAAGGTTAVEDRAVGPCPAGVPSGTGEAVARGGCDGAEWSVVVEVHG